MTFREKDMETLNTLLSNYLGDISDSERESFEDMYEKLLSTLMEHLTERQRAWVKSVYDRCVPDYQNLISTGQAPRGKEVPTIELLKRENLPLKPPSKRKLENE
jgi:hypothetical protein